MALFTLPELASYLQRDLDTATATLAREIATGLVTDVTGILESDTATVVLPVEDEGVIKLPSRVVTAVSSVVIAGVTLTVDVDYEWLRPYPRIAVYYVPVSTTSWVTAMVTATMGFPVVPPVAKAVALSVAGRAYDNPTGLRSESIDDYSATRAGSDADLAGLTLTEAEVRALSRLADGAYTTSMGRS